MASPNNYLFDDESTATDRKLSESHEELGGPGVAAPVQVNSVERLGLAGAASATSSLAGYLQHSAAASAAGYWPPLIYDWPESSPALQLQQQQSVRDDAVHRDP
ncbi:hypothetical protein TKK_0001068 [Trichogramma kaykai]